MEKYDSKVEDVVIPRLPAVVSKEVINFQRFHINYTTSHILKSLCTNGEVPCTVGDPNCCDLCLYQSSLELPHLPDMVFYNNVLTIEHENGAKLSFNPMDALKRVRNEKLEMKVSCSEQWQESRPRDLLEEKVKPFDWTFTTDYQGSTNDKFKIEPTEKKIDKFKLMVKEEILFYTDLTLFEDELHDHGIAALSVKVRVMPSGFYVLLRFFLRVDDVIIRMNETRFHYETGNDYILKEYTSRESEYSKMKHIPPALFTNPNEIAERLPINEKTNEILKFEL